MRPLRLFTILAFMTAVGLGVVYYRVASIQAAYRIHRLDARWHELSYQVWAQKAEEACLTEPQSIRDLVQTEQLKLRPPTLAPPPAQPPATPAPWETD